MGYMSDFNKNVIDFLLYSNRCNLPEYNRLESLRSIGVDPCPVCDVSPGLSLHCENFTSVSIWNRLSFQ